MAWRPRSEEIAMSDAFVWFHHNSDAPQGVTGFYQQLLGWKAAPGPGGMTMLAGEQGPFAATGVKYGPAPGWIPFVEVGDVAAATRRASELGATVVQGKTRGPAGELAVISDPGGAALALWQKA
jgi:predicted enzyme related to lactoylglutathione lyase